MSLGPGTCRKAGEGGVGRGFGGLKDPYFLNHDGAASDGEDEEEGLRFSDFGTLPVQLGQLRQTRLGHGGSGQSDAAQLGELSERLKTGVCDLCFGEFRRGSGTR